MGQCNKILTPDEPGESAYINITALQDTSLLVFHVTDIEKTNIPLYFNDDTKLWNTEDGFYLCTKELHDDGHCSNIGEFVIRYENGGPQEEIINKLVQKDDKLTYNITDDGVYCIYTHTIDGEGVQYKISQPYGTLSIDDKQRFDVILFTLIPFDMALLIYWAIQYFMSKRSDQELTSVQKTLFQICFSTYLFHDHDRIILDYTNRDDLPVGLSFWNFMRIASEFFGIFCLLTIVWLYYLWTESPSGTIVKEPHGNPFVIKSLMTTYIIFAGFFAIFPSYDTTPAVLKNLINTFYYGEMLMKPIIWGTLVLYLNNTIMKTTNSQVKRKFELSRQLVISLPVFIVFTSIFCQFVTSFDTFARSLKKSQSNEAVVVNALENSVHYGFVFGLIKNLGDFTLPLISIGLIYIWRPEGKSNELHDGFENEIELGEIDDNERENVKYE